MKSKNEKSNFRRLHIPPKKVRKNMAFGKLTPQSMYLYERSFSRYLANDENRDLYKRISVGLKNGLIGSVESVRIIPSTLTEIDLLYGK